MADKIDNINGYDIDLPPDATPSITSLTATTVFTNSISAGQGSLTLAYGLTPSGQTQRGVIFKESLSDYEVKLYSQSLTSNVSIILPSANGTLATQEWVTSQGYTSNTGTVTSVRVQAGTGLSSSQSTAQTSTLNTTISIASGYKLPTTTEWDSKSSVSGVNDGTNWTSITINGTTKSIPSGGGGTVYRHSVIFRDDNANPFKFVFYSTSSVAITTATSGAVATMMQYCIVGSATTPGLYMHLGAITGAGKGRTIPFVQMYKGTTSIVYYEGALSFGVGTLNVIGDSVEAI